jgi:hypothetical protein
MSYHEEARLFIDKLLHMQEAILRKYQGYPHFGITSAMGKIRIGFDIYPTKTDSGMKKFWNRYREAIKYLIPGEKYSGHNKLMEEFNHLDNVEVFQPIIQKQS